jgi:hypothetical protein
VILVGSVFRPPARISPQCSPALGEGQRVNNEIEIEDAIIADAEALGFPEASAIRRVRVSPDTGVVDLMLLPADGTVKLVLIEVKDERNREALSKVVGQLPDVLRGSVATRPRRIGSNPRICKDEGRGGSFRREDFVGQAHWHDTNRQSVVNLGERTKAQSQRYPTLHRPILRSITGTLGYAHRGSRASRPSH